MNESLILGIIIGSVGVILIILGAMVVIKPKEDLNTRLNQHRELSLLNDDEELVCRCENSQDEAMCDFKASGRCDGLYIDGKE